MTGESQLGWLQTQVTLQVAWHRYADTKSADALVTRTSASKVK